MIKQEIPKEVLTILNDSSVSLIEKVKLAHDHCNESWYSVGLIMKILKLSNGQYYRYLRVINSQNTKLFKLVAEHAMTVSTASILLEKPRCNIHSRLEEVNADILYMSHRTALYIYEGNCYLSGASYCDGEEQRFLIKNCRQTIDYLLNLFENDYYLMGSRMYSPDGLSVPLGIHLYAQYHSIAIEDIQSCRIKRRKPKNNGIVDLRPENIYISGANPFADIQENTAIVRKDNDLLIIRKTDGLVTYTDFSESMRKTLTSHGSIHVKSKDNRLCIMLNKTLDPYLYHLRLIEHLYGLPGDNQSIIALVNRFKATYLQNGMCIDHIDGDCQNNRLSNLILMTVEENTKKSFLHQQIRKLGYPYFCWAERYDDTNIRLQAGYFSQFKKPTFIVEGVFSITQFMDELQWFIKSAQQEKDVFEGFEISEGDNYEVWNFV